MKNKLNNHQLVEKVGLVLLSSLLYAITYVAIDLGTQTIPPATLTVLRLITAATIYGVILIKTRVRYPIHKRTVVDLMILGLLNIGIPFLLTATALKFISSSLTAILINTIPVFTLLMAHFFLKDEKLSWVKAVGTLTAILGAAIILINGETGLEIDNHRQGLVGQGLIIGCSLSSAAGIIFMRLRFQRVPTVVLGGGQVLASLVVMLPFALLTEGFPDLSTISLPSWLGMLTAALSAPVAAYWLLIYMVDKYSASLGGFSGVATPLFSVLIGVLFLSEVITTPIAIGTTFLVLGVLTINYF